jgi:hypothetical protein
LFPFTNSKTQPIKDWDSDSFHLFKEKEKNSLSFFPKTLKNTKNVYLRFVYFSKNREELQKYFRQNNILL